MTLRTDLALIFALGYTKSGAWPLGTVHEVRLEVRAPQQRPLIITHQVTRRRDLRGPRGLTG